MVWGGNCQASTSFRKTAESKRVGLEALPLNNMKRITLHVGLHKTGTTFLQEHIFPQLPSPIRYLRRYDRHLNIITPRYEECLLISDEGVSGKLFGGRYYQDFADTLRSIQLTYGDPKIIFGFRRQTEWVEPVYKQYLEEGG